MSANDLPLNGLFRHFHPPSKHRWPIDFTTENSRNGVILMLSMVVFGTAWGFLTLIIYLIKGRHAKSKHCLDDDDDDVTEKHKTAGASMMSLKRKEQIGEPGSENIVAVIQLTT